MESLETIDNQEDKYQSIIDQIKDLDILDITPISALNILNDIIEEVKKKA
jgi:hypothetical protein